MKQTFKQLRQITAVFLIAAFFLVTIAPTQYSHAQMAVAMPTGTFNMPAVGTMMGLTEDFDPLLIKGLKLYPEEPFRLDFIMDAGETDFKGDVLKSESTRLIKYFLASLTVPDDEMWVNLSPYEKERIIPEAFGVTEMGRDLLAQDYILKQLTASLMYPEEDLGRTFWDKIRTQAREEFGITEIPLNVFNKVWIVPEEALIYEHDGGAFVANSHLKVMMEKDYLTSQESGEPYQIETDQSVDQVQQLSSQVIREVLLPAIEKEVNQGAHFATLRQIYHSLILAVWFKRKIQKSILGEVYVGKNLVGGVDVADKDVKHKIYEQYIQAFQQGAYDYIKEDYDPQTQQIIPRKYFSGGFSFEQAKFKTTTDKDMAQGIDLDRAMIVKTEVDPDFSDGQDVNYKNDEFYSSVLSRKHKKNVEDLLVGAINQDIFNENAQLTAGGVVFIADVLFSYLNAHHETLKKTLISSEVRAINNYMIELLEESLINGIVQRLGMGFEDDLKLITKRLVEMNHRLETLIDNEFTQRSYVGKVRKIQVFDRIIKNIMHRYQKASVTADKENLSEKISQRVYLSIASILERNRTMLLHGTEYEKAFIALMAGKDIAHRIIIVSPDESHDKKWQQRLDFMFDESSQPVFIEEKNVENDVKVSDNINIGSKVLIFRPLALKGYSSQIRDLKANYVIIDGMHDKFNASKIHQIFEQVETYKHSKKVLLANTQGVKKNGFIQLELFEWLHPGKAGLRRSLLNSFSNERDQKLIYKIIEENMMPFIESGDSKAVESITQNEAYYRNLVNDLVQTYSSLDVSMAKITAVQKTDALDKMLLENETEIDSLEGSSLEDFGSESNQEMIFNEGGESFDFIDQELFVKLFERIKSGRTYAASNNKRMDLQVLAYLIGFDLYAGEMRTPLSHLETGRLFGQYSKRIDEIYNAYLPELKALAVDMGLNNGWFINRQDQKLLLNQIEWMHKEFSDEYQAIISFIYEEVGEDVHSVTQVFSILKSLFTIDKFAQHFNVDIKTAQEMIAAHQLKTLTISDDKSLSVMFISPQGVKHIEELRYTALEEITKEYFFLYQQELKLESISDLKLWNGSGDLFQIFPFFDSAYIKNSHRFWYYKVKTPMIGLNTDKRYYPPSEIKRVKGEIVNKIFTNDNIAMLQRAGLIDPDFEVKDINLTNDAAFEALYQMASDIILEIQAGDQWQTLEDFLAENKYSELLGDVMIETGIIPNVKFNLINQNPVVYIPKKWRLSFTLNHVAQFYDVESTATNGVLTTNDILTIYNDVNPVFSWLIHKNIKSKVFIDSLEDLKKTHFERYGSYPQLDSLEGMRDWDTNNDLLYIFPFFEYGFIRKTKALWSYKINIPISGLPSGVHYYAPAEIKRLKRIVVDAFFTNKHIEILEQVGLLDENFKIENFDLADEDVFEKLYQKASAIILEIRDGEDWQTTGDLHVKFGYSMSQIQAMVEKGEIPAVDINIFTTIPKIFISVDWDPEKGDERERDIDRMYDFLENQCQLETPIEGDVKALILEHALTRDQVIRLLQARQMKNFSTRKDVFLLKLDLVGRAVPYMAKKRFKIIEVEENEKFVLLNAQLLKLIGRTFKTKLDLVEYLEDKKNGWLTVNDVIAAGKYKNRDRVHDAAAKGKLKTVVVDLIGFGRHRMFILSEGLGFDDQAMLALSEDEVLPVSVYNQLDETLLLSEIERMHQEQEEEFADLVAFLNVDTDNKVETVEEVFDACLGLYELKGFARYLNVGISAVKAIKDTHSLDTFSINKRPKGVFVFLSKESTDKIDTLRQKVLEMANTWHFSHYDIDPQLKSIKELLSWKTSQQLHEIFPFLKLKFIQESKALWSHIITEKKVGLHTNIRYFPPAEIARLKKKTVKKVITETNVQVLKNYGALDHAFKMVGMDDKEESVKKAIDQFFKQYDSKTQDHEKIEIDTLEGDVFEMVYQIVSEVILFVEGEWQRSDVFQSKYNYSPEYVNPRFKSGKIPSIDLNIFKERAKRYIPERWDSLEMRNPLQNLIDAKDFLEEECEVDVPSLDVVKDLVAVHAFDHDRFVALLGAEILSDFSHRKDTVTLKVDSGDKKKSYMPDKIAYRIIREEYEKFESLKMQVFGPGGGGFIQTKKAFLNYLEGWLTVEDLVASGRYKTKSAVYSAIADGRLSSVLVDLIGFGFNEKRFIKPAVSMPALASQRRMMKDHFLMIFNQVFAPGHVGVDEDDVLFLAESLYAYKGLGEILLKLSSASIDQADRLQADWNNMMEEDLVKAVALAFVDGSSDGLTVMFKQLVDQIESLRKDSSLFELQNQRIAMLNSFLVELIKMMKEVVSTEYKVFNEHLGIPVHYETIAKQKAAFRVYLSMVHILQHKGTVLLAQGAESERVMAALLASKINRNGIDQNRVFIVTPNNGKSQLWGDRLKMIYGQNIEISFMHDTKSQANDNKIRGIKSNGKKFVILDASIATEYKKSLDDLFADFVIIDGELDQFNHEAISNILMGFNGAQKIYLANQSKLKQEGFVSSPLFQRLAQDQITFFEELLSLFPFKRDRQYLYESFIGNFLTFDRAPEIIDSKKDVAIQKVRFVASDESEFFLQRAKQRFLEKAFFDLSRTEADQIAALPIKRNRVEAFYNEREEKELVDLFINENNGVAFDLLTEELMRHADALLDHKMAEDQSNVNLRKNMHVSAQYGLWHALVNYRQEHGRITAYALRVMNTWIEQDLHIIKYPPDFKHKNVQLVSNVLKLRQEIFEAKGFYSYEYNDYLAYDSEYVGSVDMDLFKRQLSFLKLSEFSEGRNFDLFGRNPVFKGAVKGGETITPLVAQRVLKEVFSFLADQGAPQRGEDFDREMKVLAALVGFDLDKKEIVSYLSLTEIEDSFSLSRFLVKKIESKYMNQVKQRLEFLKVPNQEIQMILQRSANNSSDIQAALKDVFVFLAEREDIRLAADYEREIEILAALAGFDLDKQESVPYLSFQEIEELFSTTKRFVNKIKSKYINEMMTILEDLEFSKLEIKVILKGFFRPGRTKGTLQLEEVIDAAMVTNSSDVGGIDLNPQNLQIKVDGEVFEMEFEGVIEQLEGLSGFVPVILNIEPLLHPAVMLGL